MSRSTADNLVLLNSLLWLPGCAGSDEEEKDQGAGIGRSGGYHGARYYPGWRGGGRGGDSSHAAPGGVGRGGFGGSGHAAS